MKRKNSLLAAVMILVMLLGTMTVWAKEDKPTPDQQSKDPKTSQEADAGQPPDDAYYFTEDTDYSQIKRRPYEEIDWSKYGNNGIQDKGTREYLESLGIDAQTDATYGITLAKKLASQPQPMSFKDDWRVGSQHWGMCDITSSWFVPSEGQSYFTLGNFRDGLDGVEVIGSGWCADHTAAEPPAGHGVVSVVCTVTAVNYENGWVDMSLYLTPWDATQGEVDDKGLLVGYQHIAANVHVKKNFKGSLKLAKSSANPGMTNANSCYSLSGAQYGVYSDSGCTNKVGTLTTDANGNSNQIDLVEGDYWVKESTAPKGFALDRKVHKVTVTARETETLRVADIPTLDPVGVVLGKIDKETSQNKPVGTATLEGALFQMKYYSGLYNEDPAQDGKKPTRAWVFRTNKNGFCEYNTQFLESGDELYLSPSGVPSLPIGTITIQETMPPEGYLLNPEVYVVQITSKNDGSELVYTYNEPAIPEASLNLDLTKALQETGKAIPGAVFRHTRPDKSTEDLTTDDKGKLSFKGLTWGTHTIEELSVPDGYTRNPGIVTFTVEKNNKITVLSNTSEDATGKMSFTIQKNGCPLLEVEDILAPYELILKKQNESGKLLSGAEFTLYSDKDCKSELAKAVTEPDGTLRFPGLTVNQNYYLKETKAPAGYRIPVNVDGSDRVYTLRTESDPEEDLFVYYVDGKKHTGSDGAFAITGTKAKREVHLEVLNYTGVKMPNTGSHVPLVLFLIGVGCMAGALYHNRKDGKQTDEKKQV